MESTGVFTDKDKAAAHLKVWDSLIVNSAVSVSFCVYHSSQFKLKSLCCMLVSYMILQLFYNLLLFHESVYAIRVDI